MELLKEIWLSSMPMEEQPECFWASMEQLELSVPEQKDQALRGLLVDQHLRLASTAAIGLQINDNPAHDDDGTTIQQLLEDPQDEGDLDEWLSGVLRSSPSQETNVNHQMEGMRSSPEMTRSLLSKKRGIRKKRMSPWNPLFFERRRRSAIVSMPCTPRKNNSRWTQKEVELLVKGISEYGIGRWTEMKGKYFKHSIRTSVNLKDKWRNLLKAYDDKFTSKTKKKVQKTTLLHLEQPLIKRIRDLAEKHRRGCEAALSDSSSSSNTSNDSFLTF
ncbi:hypothetical protein QOZ80_2AG0126020 [Eleusine coracana subsp. coracana]|nr:hypothetical protein QOZ80_2AG0126020 [Eleusine coracana subsp. coracana]